MVKQATRRKPPYLAAFVLSAILLGCLFVPLLRGSDPTYLDLKHMSEAPNWQFPFGTDPLGRNLFTMIWHGGRISIYAGLLATFIATGIGIVYGSVSGLSSKRVDAFMMRAIEIILSMPSILLIIFVQAMIGYANPTAIAIVIGISSWMHIAKIVRNEVRQIGKSDYILASRYAGGGFFYVLRRHLVPNFISAISFMVVSNIGSAIGTEATLSFLGIGLPIEIVSWGSMLSLSEKALLTNQWWVILIPGGFLAITLLCINAIADYGRKKNNKEFSHL